MIRKKKRENEKYIFEVEFHFMVHMLLFSLDFINIDHTIETLAELFTAVKLKIHNHSNFKHG